MNQSLWRVANQALSTLAKHILRMHKPPRVGSGIKLHKNINNLIKKDHVCYSTAPSTTNQNATQRIYIKDIKWLGNPYRHTVLNAV